MAAIPRDLQEALEADEAGELSALIQARNTEHLQALREIAEDPDADSVFRSRAIYALGAWGDARAASSITRHINELDDQGRLSAIQALGRLRTRESLPEVIRATSDPSPQVRKVAAKALSGWDDSRATEALQSVATNDEQAWVREAARRFRDR